MAGAGSGDGKAEEVKPPPAAPATPGSLDSATTPSAIASRFRPSYVFLVVVLSTIACLIYGNLIMNGVPR